jgi:hypothetical protein
MAFSQSLDDLFASHPGYSRTALTLPSKFPSCTSKVFAVSMAHIDTIKHRLGSYMPTTLTTNALVCAVVWSAITHARIQRDPALESKYSRLVTAVKGRRGLSKGFLAENNPYFGNMVLYASASVQGKDLSISHERDSGSLQLLADLCKVIAQSQSPARVDSRFVAEVHQLVDSMDDYRSVLVGWYLFGSRNLTITSWDSMVWTGDGLGKPEFVRVPYTKADGVEMAR